MVFLCFSLLNATVSISANQQSVSEPKKCDFSKLKLPPQCAIKQGGAYEYPFVEIECENTFSASKWCNKNPSSSACTAKKTKIFSTACKPDGTFKDNIAFSNLFGNLVGFGVPEGCDIPRFDNGYISLECSNSTGYQNKVLNKTPLFFSPFFHLSQTPYFFISSRGLNQIYIPENCSVHDLEYQQGELSFSCLKDDKSLKQHRHSIQFEGNSLKLVTSFFEKNDTELLSVWHPYECLIRKHQNNMDLYVSCEPDQDVNTKVSDPEELIKERKFFQLFSSEKTEQLLVIKTEDNKYNFWDVPLACNASSVTVENKKMKISCARNIADLKTESNLLQLEIPQTHGFVSQNICKLRQIEDHSKQMKLTASCNKGALANLLPQRCASKYMQLENNIMTVSCLDKNNVQVNNVVPIICDCSGTPVNTVFLTDENGILTIKTIMAP